MSNERQLFGQTLEVNDDGNYFVDEEKFDAMMSELGATKEMRNKITSARSKIYNEAVNLLADEFCEDNDGNPKRFRTREEDHATQITVSGIDDPNTENLPAVGEYGFVKVDHSTYPEGLFDSEVINNIEKRCEEHFSAKQMRNA